MASRLSTRTAVPSSKAPRKPCLESDNSEDDDAMALFRHSKTAFREVLEETAAARRREEQLEKEKPAPKAKPALKIGKEVSPTEEDKKPRSSAKQRSKRRKLAGDGEDYTSTRGLNSRTSSQVEKLSCKSDSDDLIVNDKGKGKECGLRATNSSWKRKETAPLMLDSDSDYTVSKTTSRRIHTTSRKLSRDVSRRDAPAAVTIDLSESDDEQKDLPPKSIAKTKSAETVEIDDDKPEEEMDGENDVFAKYIIQARERALRAQATTEKSPVESQDGTSSNTPTASDVAVVISVTSELHGTHNLVAKRKLYQTVGLLLETWINTQKAAGFEIDAKEADGLFLTWRGNKIYKTSTVASLGVMVDARGDFQRSRMEPDGPEAGYSGNGLLVQVWNEELYGQYLAKEEKKRLRGLGEPEVDEEEISTAAEAETAAAAARAKVKGIKVVLKAKDMKPVTLTVYLDTVVRELKEAFRVRSNREVQPGTHIAIHFDGEALEDDTLVSELDLDTEDSNQFEVYL